jgi:hypothetical protein
MHAGSGVHRRPPPPRAFPTLEPDAPDALAEEAAALRERARQRRNRDPGLAARELDASDKLDWALAVDACEDSMSISSVGPDLACALCHRAACPVDCALHARTLLTQARYDWLVAARDGCVRTAARARTVQGAFVMHWPSDPTLTSIAHAQRDGAHAPARGHAGGPGAPARCHPRRR